MKFLTQEQIRDALIRLRKGKKYQYLIIKTLAWTGVRASELINIRPIDLLEVQKQIIVRGKGDKIRNVDVDIELILDLQEFIKEKKIKNKKPIFPYTRRNIYYLTDRLVSVGPHALRHSYAIALLKKTKNIRYVSEQLGHSSLSHTTPYLRFMDFTDEKQKLGSLYDV